MQTENKQDRTGTRTPNLMVKSDYIISSAVSNMLRFTYTASLISCKKNCTGKKSSSQLQDTGSRKCNEHRNKRYKAGIKPTILAQTPWPVINGSHTLGHTTSNSKLLSPSKAF